MFKFLFKLKFLGFVEAPVGVFIIFTSCFRDHSKTEIITKPTNSFARGYGPTARHY